MIKAYIYIYWSIDVHYIIIRTLHHEFFQFCCLSGYSSSSTKTPSVFTSASNIFEMVHPSRPAQRLVFRRLHVRCWHGDHSAFHPQTRDTLRHSKKALVSSQGTERLGRKSWTGSVKGSLRGGWSYYITFFLLILTYAINSQGFESNCYHYIRTTMQLPHPMIRALMIDLIPNQFLWAWPLGNLGSTCKER